MRGKGTEVIVNVRPFFILSGELFGVFVFSRYLRDVRTVKRLSRKRTEWNRSDDVRHEESLWSKRSLPEYEGRHDEPRRTGSRDRGLLLRPRRLSSVIDTRVRRELP